MPFGETEVLLYYGIVGSKLLNFLKDKELVGELKAYTPNKVMDELNSVSKRLVAL